MSRLADELWERAYEEAFNSGMSDEDAMAEADQALEDAASAATDYEYDAWRDRQMMGEDY